MTNDTFVQQLNAAETIVTAVAVGFIKGFVHCIFLIALGAYTLGKLCRSLYEEYITDESLKAVKQIAAANHETAERTNDKVVETDDFWLQAMDEAIADHEDRARVIGGIQNDSEYHYTIELPSAAAFKAPYYDWKAGRCKKGYRKIGNQCVLKEYVQYVK